jgi:hypothetical protein
MRKSIVILTMILSSTAFAKDYGSISLNDGNTILRIDIGNEREGDSRQMGQRITRLERAVREL